MQISREWLDAHRTDRGSWTYVQMRAIGVKWPQPTGWIGTVIGKTISEEKASEFEAGKLVFSAKTLKNRRKEERALLTAMGKEIPAELVEQPKQQAPTNPKSIRRAAKKAAKRARRQENARKVEALNAKLAGRPVVTLVKPATSNPARAPKIRASMGAVYVEGVSVVTTEFLSTFAWRQLRVRVLRHYGARCMCCGASPATGAVMNVDHIKPRKLFPHLALEFDNLQVLCGECNHGKGNWCQDDWREQPLDADQADHLRAILNS